ncbi:MAG: hypothetical protein RI988_266, partial [Pseudomonadota bacterium]
MKAAPSSVSSGTALPVLGPDCRLTADALEGHLTRLPGWSLRDGALERRYTFPDFDAAMAFAQCVATLAARRDHHPELRVAWGACTVRWHTHAA